MNASDYLWRSHSYIVGDLRFADTKAGAALVLATAVVGGR